MPTNQTKTAQLLDCPHCGKKIYITTAVDILGIVASAKKEDVDKIKLDIISKIHDGTFPREITFDEKKEILEWLTDPETVLMPQDVDDFLATDK
jgi:hypothetical protein